MDVVVRQSSAIFQLLSSEDQSLLVRGNTFFVLDLLFHSLDGVRGFNFKSDGFSSQSFHEDLHTSAKSKNQVESRFFLDVIVRESTSVFQLLSSENQSLLIGGNSFLILNLLFHSLDSIRGFNFESDCFSSQSFHEDLHTSTKSENQVESRFFLNVVVRESSAVFQLLSSEDQSLLIRGNSFFVLDLLFHGLDSIRGFDFESDSLSGQSFHENLHVLLVGWLVVSQEKKRK